MKCRAPSNSEADFAALAHVFLSRCNKEEEWRIPGIGHRRADANGRENRLVIAAAKVRAY